MKSNFCETFEQISRGISAGSGNRPRISSGQAPPGDVQKALRRRVRACYLKQWRKSKTRLKQLIKLGVSKRDPLGAAKSSKGPWRLSRTLPVQRGLSIEFLAEQGLFNLEEYWASLHQ